MHEVSSLGLRNKQPRETGTSGSTEIRPTAPTEVSYRPSLSGGLLERRQTPALEVMCPKGFTPITECNDLHGQHE